MNTIYLYGIGGADDCYRVIRYEPIAKEDLSIFALKIEASMMAMRYPGVKRIFAIDSRPGLSKMVMNSMRKKSIEDCVILLDFLERNGIELKI